MGGERDEHDKYYTPVWCTRALIHYLGDRLTGVAWEPCAGANHIVDVLREHSQIDDRIWASDIAPNGWPIMGHDFLGPPPGMFGNPSKPDWIISNPPYSTDTGTATEVIEHALDLVDNVAMLVRVGWLEPCADREALLTERPPTDVIMLPRVHYIGAPTQNNQTSVWVVWEKGAERRPHHTYPQAIRKPTYDWSRAT